MHGPAVVSLAVGRTIGVAPEADLYYIDAMTGSRGLFGWSMARSGRHPRHVRVGGAGSGVGGREELSDESGAEARFQKRAVSPLGSPG